jgi:hypothetical protein
MNGKPKQNYSPDHYPTFNDDNPTLLLNSKGTWLGR